VQLRHNTTLTSKDYVTHTAWHQATLDVCPRHPEGGCGFASHGTYPRVKPSGMRVARWYCPKAQTTFSLLPDCMCARMGGSLDETERVVALSDRIGVEKAAMELRVGEVELPGALRWLRRRRQGVRAALLALITALPGQLGSAPEIEAMRLALKTERLLVALREIGTAQLHSLPAPLGFGRRVAARAERGNRPQHETGRDKPSP
jgi:hypothetical protein